MRKMSELEARSLLAYPTYTVGKLGWIRSPHHPETFLLATGLVDEDGAQVHLQIELRFSFIGPALRRYVFTVFKTEKYGPEIVYQLDVTQSPRPIKDVHKRSHEHIGRTRIGGSAEWMKWRYDQVLAFFCEQTNIVFDVVPLPPKNAYERGNDDLHTDFGEAWIRLPCSDRRWLCRHDCRSLRLSRRRRCARLHRTARRPSQVF